MLPCEYRRFQRGGTFSNAELFMSIIFLVFICELDVKATKLKQSFQRILGAYESLSFTPTEITGVLFIEYSRILSHPVGGSFLQLTTGCGHLYFSVPTCAHGNACTSVQFKLLMHQFIKLELSFFGCGIARPVALVFCPLAILSYLNSFIGCILSFWYLLGLLNELNHKKKLIR